MIHGRFFNNSLVESFKINPKKHFRRFLYNFTDTERAQLAFMKNKTHFCKHGYRLMSHHTIDSLGVDIVLRAYSRPWFNINMSSYQYRKSHCGDKTVVRSSYLHNGISFTGKMSYLYWIRTQMVSFCNRCCTRNWYLGVTQCLHLTILPAVGIQLQYFASLHSVSQIAFMMQHCNSVIWHRCCITL